jgi:hypothetical protein
LNAIHPQGRGNQRRSIVPAGDPVRLHDQEAGFWGDFMAYITTGSTVGTTRFGDYVTLRQTPRTRENPGNLFNAYGYGLNPNPDVHYVVFGRPASTACRGQ